MTPTMLSLVTPETTKLIHWQPPTFSVWHTWLKFVCNEQTFHKMFILWLYDQYRQNLLGFIKTLSRFRVISSLKDGVELSPYITQIRNPDIRQIFTRLRIDLNCLVTCKTKKILIQRDTCPFCHIDGESVEHFFWSALILINYVLTLRIAFATSFIHMTT